MSASGGFAQRSRAHDLNVLYPPILGANLAAILSSMSQAHFIFIAPNHRHRDFVRSSRPNNHRIAALRAQPGPFSNTLELDEKG